MAAVAVLHPQDVYNHSSLISPAMNSRRRFPNPSPLANNNHRSSPSRSSPSKRLKRRRLKRSPTKKDPFSSKEVKHKAATTAKPRATPKPKLTSTNCNNNNLVTGHVKILKRGETLPSPPISTSPPPDSPPSTYSKANHVIPKKIGIGASDDLLGLSSADRMGPAEPDFFPKKICFPDCYAGTAFVSSPPPSLLPVPAFFKKKNLVLGDDKNNSTGTSANDATTDLLKLLRLDLS